MQQNICTYPFDSDCVGNKDNKWWSVFTVFLQTPAWRQEDATHSEMRSSVRDLKGDKSWVNMKYDITALFVHDYTSFLYNKNDFFYILIFVFSALLCVWLDPSVWVWWLWNKRGSVNRMQCCSEFTDYVNVILVPSLFYRPTVKVKQSHRCFAKLS